MLIDYLFGFLNFIPYIDENQESKHDNVGQGGLTNPNRHLHEEKHAFIGFDEGILTF